MTEEKAKTKWCPMSKLPSAVLSAKSAGQVSGEFASRAKCIGSACMMWRASEYETKGTSIGKPTIGKPITGPGGEGWEFVRAEVVDDFTHEQMATWRRAIGGYCGLAGKP